MSKHPGLKTPFKLGNITLPNNIFYSPLAGCSDYPFRQMSSRFRPGLIYCEMVKMDALVRHDKGTFHLLDYAADTHPIGAQLVGNNLAVVGQAARIIEDLGFDVLDLNCGCPVDKVTKDGGGSGLLKEPERIGDLLAKMVAAVKIPVTVKIRSGWDDEHINASEIVKVAEQAGAVAIAIHGRTRKQAYRGPADWEVIRRAKEAANTIKVIGNGDVLNGASARRLLDQTGCDAVLASRGTLGAPWIAEDIYRELSGLPPLDRGEAFRRQQLTEHFDLMCQYHPEHRAVIDMRRVGCWYIKKGARTRDFRRAVSSAQTVKEVRGLIASFSWEEEG